MMLSVHFISASLSAWSSDALTRKSSGDPVEASTPDSDSPARIWPKSLLNASRLRRMFSCATRLSASTCWRMPLALRSLLTCWALAAARLSRRLMMVCWLCSLAACSCACALSMPNCSCVAAARRWAE